MPIFIPRIRSYASFFIQRMDAESAVDIQASYGITVKTHEYPSKLKMKAPYVKPSLASDGDTEWAEKVWAEAFTLRLQCVVFTVAADSEFSRMELRNAVRDFQNELRSGEFYIYDSWTKFGFQHVRIQEFSEIGDADFSEKDGRCRLIFDVLFKVNDPTTRVVMSNGVLTVAQSQ